MIYYSVWMAVVIVAGVLFMAYMTKVLGSRSARNFVAQQKEIGVVEGHVEEVMNGQQRGQGLLPRGRGPGGL